MGEQKMKWPWTKKKVEINHEACCGGLCSCAKCGETVPMYGDCFCDRIDKGTLTEADKKWLEENPNYK
jgi:hypothetical protein